MTHITLVFHVFREFLVIVLCPIISCADRVVCTWKFEVMNWCCSSIPTLQYVHVWRTAVREIKETRWMGRQIKRELASYRFEFRLHTAGILQILVHIRFEFRVSRYHISTRVLVQRMILLYECSYVRQIQITKSNSWNFNFSCSRQPPLALLYEYEHDTSTVHT